MQHQRRLDQPGMRAELFFPLVDQPIRQAEPREGGGDRQHAVPRAAFERRGRHGGDVAAMRADEHELAQAGARHALRLRQDRPDHLRGGKAERARKALVLERRADRLHRQDDDAELVRRAARRLGDQAFGDEAIRAGRQMRAVLLGRGERQHGDGAARIERADLRR